MGIFDKLGKGLGMSSKEIDVEEYMNAAEMENVDVMHEPADHYIKPVALMSQSDIDLIKKELGDGNIILMNITEMAKRPNTLKTIVDDLKDYTDKIDGDIARISEDKILLTPVKIKIIKTKRPPQR
ncbi:MAG TPA: cell division protein SepF [Candidatus Acidoferrales bacterium]|nr:cell division protein SepF [Candidatus Acidoferrales bacterium]